jgi:hypothetical protein
MEAGAAIAPRRPARAPRRYRPGLLLPRVKRRRAGEWQRLLVVVKGRTMASASWTPAPSRKRKAEAI